MKKFLCILFTTIICFISIRGVNARVREFNCRYDSASFEYTLPLKVQNMSSTAHSSKFKTKSTLEENNEKVRNWGTTYFKDIAFSGEKYYLKNENCPKNLILIKSNTGYNLFVSDDDNKQAILDAIKDKFSTIEDGYPMFATLVEKTQTYDELEDEPSSCLEYDETTCETNADFSCVWVKTDNGGYCNVNNLQYVKCGGAYDIPAQAPQIISLIINFLKITAPSLLVLVSIITLVKAIAASKDDEIKKAQNILIKRLIAAVILFLVIQITQFVLLKVADEADQGGIRACLSCFVNNKCDTNTYYKTNVYGVDICTYIDGTNLEDCK